MAQLDNRLQGHTEEGSGPTVASAARGGSRFRVVVYFFGYCLALQLAWVLIHPPYGISDEPAHVVKAVATASGQLHGPEVIGQFDYPAMEYSIPEAYSGIWNFVCANDLSQTPDCSDPLGSSRTRVPVSSTAAYYPPLYYVAVGWVGLPFPGDVGLYAMRAMSALFVALLAAGACWVAQRSTKPAHFTAALFVATTAQVVAFGGSVNPQSPEVAASLLFWVCGVILAHHSWTGDSERAIRVLFASATVLFASIRPASFVWMVPAALFVLASSIEPRDWRSLWTDSQRRFVLLVTSVGVVLSGVWHLAFTRTLNLGGNPIGGTLAENLRISFERSDEYFLQMFGFFGWTSFYPPLTVPMLGVTAIVLIIIASGSKRSRWSLAVLTLLILAVVLAPTVLEGARAATSGLGFQGRYLLPFAVGVPILAVALGSPPPANRRDLVLAGWSVVAAVAANVIAANHASRRFFVGLNGSYNWLIDTRWSPPGGVLIVFALLVAAVLASVMAWRALPPVASEEDPSLRSSSGVPFAVEVSDGPPR